MIWCYWEYSQVHELLVFAGTNEANVDDKQPMTCDNNFKAKDKVTNYHKTMFPHCKKPNNIPFNTL